MRNKKIRMIFCTLFFLNTTSAENLSAADNFKNKSIAPKIKSTVYFKDFGHFRKFYYKDVEITLNKTYSKNRNIIFSHGEEVTSLMITQTKAVVTTMIPSKTKRNFIVQKIEKGQKSKVGYYSVQRTKYFNSLLPQATVAKSDATSQTCSRGPNWSFSDLAEISKVLGANDSKKFSSIVADKFIDKSCKTNEDDVELLTTSIDALFKNNAKEMFKCLQSDSAQKKIELNPILLENANMFVARMTRFLDVRSIDDSNVELKNKLVDQMSSKKENKINPMKVMCAPNLDLAGKSACFKDDNENPAIIIDLKKMKRDGNQNIVAEELKKVLVHEFYHTSSQQIETPTEPGCADHAVIKSLESLCDETKKIEVAQDIKNCKVQAVVELSKTNLVIEDKQFRLATELGSQINRQGNQLQGSNNLTSNDLEGIRQTNADINTLSAPVPTAALARAESNQSPSLGSKTEITAGTPIETAVVSLYNSFSQNNTSISKALVVATSIVGSTTAIAQTQASVRANTVPYLQSEIIADKFQLPQSVVATSEQNFPSLQISNTTNATAADNKLPDVEVQKPPQKKIEVAGQNLNTDVKSDTALPSQQSVVIAVDNKISDRSIASVSIKTNPQIDTAARTTNPDTKILQTLGTVSKLSGQSYEDIKKMYNNPDFKNSLATRGIVIELNDSKRTKIGTNQKAKIIFKDNGKELSKVEDQ